MSDLIERLWDTAFTTPDEIVKQLEAQQAENERLQLESKADRLVKQALLDGVRAENEWLRGVIVDALKCTPHDDNVYDCGDPFAILSAALPKASAEGGE